MIRDQLIRQIESRRATVGIIGLGYAGLPLVLRFGQVGFDVLGFDIDSEKVSALNDGNSYISHIKSEEIARLRRQSKFRATSEFVGLAGTDCIIICVPTPLTSDREPDLQYIEKTAEAIEATLRPGQLVVLESTTYPGTTEEFIRTRLEKTGLQVGKDFFLAYSPEREDPGNVDFSTQTIPKVLGGTTPNCLIVARSLYSQVIDQLVPVSSTETAELVKLLENIYRSVNIALVNELKMLCEQMGVDIWEVIDAASTKPFGFTPFYPGPGIGGHCIPIDPFYLAWKAREHGVETRFVELAGQINSAMPKYVVGKTVSALKDHGKSVQDSHILILGVAYKKGIDDVRESPALEIMNLLQEKGGQISYHDPFVPKLHKMRHYDFSNLESENLTESLLQNQDAIVIATDHETVDYQWVVKNSSLLIDTRNATKGIIEGPGKIVRA